MPDSGVFRLIYRSHALIADDERGAELGRLFGHARAANHRVGVTGALLISDDTFVQALEGNEGEVRTIFARIEADPRHERITVLEDGGVDRKVFGKWKMAHVGLGGGTDIPLVAQSGGVAVAAEHRSTVEREAVLDVMRDAARGGDTPP